MPSCAGPSRHHPRPLRVGRE